LYNISKENIIKEVVVVKNFLFVVAIIMMFSFADIRKEDALIAGEDDSIEWYSYELGDTLL